MHAPIRCAHPGSRARAAERAEPDGDPVLAVNQPPLELAASQRLELAHLGDEFLVAVLRLETASRPDNLEALADLGHALGRLGRHGEGLEVDQELVRRAPQDCVAHYNLGCTLALLGRPDDALDELERATELGYADGPAMLADADLASLREAPRFRALVRRLGGTAHEE